MGYKRNMINNQCQNCCRWSCFLSSTGGNSPNPHYFIVPPDNALNKRKNKPKLYARWTIVSWSILKQHKSIVCYKEELRVRRLSNPSFYAAHRLHLSTTNFSPRLLGRLYMLIQLRVTMERLWGHKSDVKQLPARMNVLLLGSWPYLVMFAVWRTIPATAAALETVSLVKASNTHTLKHTGLWVCVHVYFTFFVLALF